MLELAVVVLIVIVTSAACSLFEAVLYSAPMSHVESLAKAGKPGGIIFKTLRTNVDRPIAAILILNTLANTGGAAVAGAIASQVLGSAWLGYFSAVFTLAILMLSETIPKTAGVIYASRLTPIVAYPLKLLVSILTPFIWLSQLSTRLIVRKQQHRVSDEDLLMMIQLGIRSGDFQTHEASMIENILSLEAKKAREIMTPRTVVFTLDANTTIEDAKLQDGLLGHSRIPIYAKDLDDVIGIVHRRDVLAVKSQDEPDLMLKGLMRKAHFIVDSAPLDKLLRTFLEQREHLVIVIDEFGGFAGVLSLEDILEEILGREIVDEFDSFADLREVARQRRITALENKGSKN